jgi:hypothetical protein
MKIWADDDAYQAKPLAAPRMSWGVLLVVVLVSCGLRTAVLVPLILWGPL